VTLLGYNFEGTKSEIKTRNFSYELQWKVYKFLSLERTYMVLLLRNV